MNRFHSIALALLALAFAACLAAPESEAPLNGPESAPLFSGEGACEGAGQSCSVATDGGAVSGRCDAFGVCCTGCLLGGVCFHDDSAGQCGTAGAACSTGGCVEGDVDGVCLYGDCCTGCRHRNGLCLSGTTAANCGAEGAVCVACGSAQTCSSGVCI